MDFIRSIAMQLPAILASLFLLLAAILKVGKEKGGVLVMCGAILLCVMPFVNSVIYSGVMPRLTKINPSLNMHNAYMILGVLIGGLWAIAIAMIALGTLIRPPAGNRQSPGR